MACQALLSAVFLVVVGAAEDVPLEKSELNWINVLTGFKRFRSGQPGALQNVLVGSSQEYIVSCSANHADFYRVSRYPNLYPHWTHLFYGNLTFRTPSVDTCLLAPGSGFLCTAEIVGEELRLVGYTHAELHGIDNRGRFLRRKGPSVNDLETLSRFHTVHPRDHFDEMWLEEAAIDELRASGVEVELFHRGVGVVTLPLPRSTTSPPAMALDDDRVAIALPGAVYVVELQNSTTPHLVTLATSAVAPIGVCLLCSGRVVVAADVTHLDAWLFHANTDPTPLSLSSLSDTVTHLTSLNCDDQHVLITHASPLGYTLFQVSVQHEHGVTQLESALLPTTVDECREGRSALSVGDHQDRLIAISCSNIPGVFVSYSSVRLTTLHATTRHDTT